MLEKVKGSREHPSPLRVLSNPKMELKLTKIDKEDKPGLSKLSGKLSTLPSSSNGHEDSTKKSKTPSITSTG